MSYAQKILIVDDRGENLFALEKTLSETRAEIIQATSGNDALARSLEHDFALAILDVRMPGMDGYELAELLRGESKTRHLPIIFLTAENPEDSEIFKGYEAGAVDYIVKPYNRVILSAKVSVFLRLDRQQQELHEQQRLLEAANKELEAFAYSVSHDLRAPLRGIDGFSKALLEDYQDKLDDTGRDYLNRVRAGAQRMAGLIDDLLKLSRLTRAEMQHQRLDLGELAQRIADELQRSEPERQVDFNISLGISAQGDRALLGIGLENLLRNAWKFTGHRKHARIELGVTEQAGERVYFVRDNGAGFDMAYVDKLFGVFQRLHDAADFPGSGIGLAIVKRVVSRHGGRIWAEAKVDGGATFYFTLPGVGSALSDNRSESEE